MVPALILIVRAPQQGHLPLDHRAVIDAVGGKVGQILQILRLQQALFAQQVGADQQRVAGKGRKALVGRVAITGRPERQHLPQPLLACSEQLDEIERRGTEIANAIPTRQRGRV